MTDGEPRTRPDWDEFFAQNLRATREAMGLTQSEIADRMRERGFPFHQATVYKIEKGERKVSIGEAKALSGMFDLSLDSLASEPSRSQDAEFYASVLWERSSNMIEALHDLWSSS